MNTSTVFVNMNTSTVFLNMNNSPWTPPRCQREHDELNPPYRSSHFHTLVASMQKELALFYGSQSQMRSFKVICLSSKHLRNTKAATDQGFVFFII